MEINKIYQGDALEVLKTFPDKCIDMCMTSPPYWALRDYGVEGQLGLEPTFDEYINKLCDIFDGVKRVLRDDGTCWVNISDTYGGSGAGTGGDLSKSKESLILPKGKDRSSRLRGTNLQKSLVMIPFRFAIEMVNRGWILRNTIIWHKPNCMPSSAKDRFTVDFEYLFLFSKKKKYYFETQYEPLAKATIERVKHKFNPVVGDGIVSMQSSGQRRYAEKFDEHLKKGRNKRTVWKICPRPFREAHFAVYPEELCETPLKAGCPEGGIVLDPFFGAGTTGLVALKQKKQFVGIELNHEYIKIAKARLKPYLNQEKLDG